MAKPDWVTVSPSSGVGAGSFNIVVASNASTSARSGVVTVKTVGGQTHTIEVSQAGKPANSLQGSGVFCGLGISASLFPSGVSQITFCVCLWCSNGSKVPAGHLTLANNIGESFVTGLLSLDFSKVAFNSGVTVKRVVITCNPGSKPWATPFNRCIGSLDYDPGNIAFGTVEDSSGYYSATFVQFSAAELGFNIPTPVPISGETTFVYKGDEEDIPVIGITSLR